MVSRSLRAALAAFLFLAGAGGTAAEERADLGSLFDAEGVSCTFVLLDVEKAELTTVDAERAERRFPPASTFKIANSLIALETGAVADVDEVLPYGGKPQPFKQWEKDMGLRDAIRVSNVPVYQEVARRIGLTRMKEMLAKLDYGNRDTGEVVDRFWLDGPLAISAVEQARFVAALATNTLPLSDRSQEMVRDILLMEETGGAKLYGKTGWLFRDDEVDIGWFVGWVEREGKVFSFALNIDMVDEAQVGLRVPLAKKLLEELGVL